jgi:hypothetical protein
MKIIITESQIENMFGVYLKKFKPELFELSKFPMKRADKKTVYGYEFEIGDTLILIFEYLLYPEGSNEPNDDYPKLGISRNIRNMVTNMFGEKGIKMLVNWFEDYYKLPVKSFDKL